MTQRMLDGFALYRPDPMQRKRGDHNAIGVPLGTRLHRIIRIQNGWRIWTATADYVYGTYFDLLNDGTILNITVRADEGDEVFTVRPSDEEINT
jgi:hypothetical protein